MTSNSEESGRDDEPPDTPGGATRRQEAPDDPDVGDDDHDEEDGEHDVDDHDEEDGEAESDDVAGMYDQTGAVGVDVTETDSPDLVSSEEDGDGTAGAGSSQGPASGAGISLFDDDDDGPEPESGTFFVKHAAETAATLHEVNTGQIYTIIENPGLENDDIVEATLVAQPPMEVSYLIHEIESHRSIPVEESPEPPTRNVEKAADNMEPMQAVAIDREGEGEIHILRVEPEDVERTVEELHDDEMTYKNAARYGVGRVEIRSDEDRGIVSIRYLP